VTFQFLETRQEGPVIHLTLNRPDVRNAINDEVIAELTAWANWVSAVPGTRVVVIRGAGKVFSAGADANWMARMVDYSREDNLRDAARMAEMFLTLDRLPCVVIGRVHGAALGGGAGLAAICDIVIADEFAVFGFTETKLGILPAVISPFVLPKIGPSAARELFLTGMRFSAARAKEIGLVHEVVATDQLDAAVARYITECLTASPSGIAASKRLIAQVWGQSPADATAITTEAIATQRVSPEGQDGLRAFLAKRQPGWVPKA
jgi:methylglutaconyl-CoA hydratase